LLLCVKGDTLLLTFWSLVTDVYTYWTKQCKKYTLIKSLSCIWLYIVYIYNSPHFPTHTQTHAFTLYTEDVLTPRTSWWDQVSRVDGTAHQIIPQLASDWLLRHVSHVIPNTSATAYQNIWCTINTKLTWVHIHAYTNIQTRWSEWNSNPAITDRKRLRSHDLCDKIFSLIQTYMISPTRWCLKYNNKNTPRACIIF